MVDQVKPANCILEVFQPYKTTKTVILLIISCTYLPQYLIFAQAASQQHAAKAEGRSSYHNSSLQRSRVISYPHLLSQAGTFQILFLFWLETSAASFWVSTWQLYAGSHNFHLPSIPQTHSLLEVDNQHFHLSCSQDLKKTSLTLPSLSWVSNLTCTRKTTSLKKDVFLKKKKKPFKNPTLGCSGLGCPTECLCQRLDISAN